MKLSKFKIIYLAALISIFIMFLGVIFLSINNKKANVAATKSYINITGEHAIKYVPLSLRKQTVIHEVLSSDISSIDPSKNTILFFLTSWCPHCIDEIENLKKAQEKSENVNYILVSHDKEKQDIAKFLNENKSNFFVLWDPNKYIRTKLNKEDSTVPGAYLLDKNKNIITIKKDTLSYDNIIDLINTK